MPTISLFCVGVRFSDTLLEEFLSGCVEISLIWIAALRRHVDT